MGGGASDSGRREFFREAVEGLMRPLAAYLEGKIDFPVERPYLRPPGAIEEAAFLDTCYRCGTCVDECPANAISLRQLPGHAADGTPGIDPDLAACTVCAGLKCTHACPSGALKAIRRPYEISMGEAVVAADRCVRSRGEVCSLCADRCPIGPAAIRFSDNGPPRVSPAGCVGCGMCQLHCPTQPKAIIVQPS